MAIHARILGASRTGAAVLALFLASVLRAALTVTPSPTVTIPIGSQPSFGVAISGAGDTVTDDNNNSQTNHLTYFRVRDNTTSQQWDQDLSGGGANFTWNDPRGGMAAGTHSFTLTAYYTGLSSYNDNDGADIGIRGDDNSVFDTRTVTVTAAIVAPSIVTQPTSSTKTAGLNATFSVAAYGSPPFTYQWRKNGTNITGATSPSLALVNVQAADTASYTAVVTNSVGSATSNAATLTVNAAAPTILSQPSSAQVINGTNLSLAVVASGSALTYQWRKNGTNIAGATTATLAFPSMGPADAGSYSVVLTGSLGTVTSTTAVLSTFIAVTPSPTVTIPIGSQPSFNVAITGGGGTVTDDNNNSQTNNLTHLRVKDNTTNQYWDQNLSGGSANLTWYDPRGAMAAGTHSFTLTAYYTGFSAYDNDGDIGFHQDEWSVLDAQTVAVTAGIVAPSIVTQPGSLTKTAGLTATFSVAATGSGPFTYQWRKNGTNISGATSQSLVLLNVQAADATSYTVVVSNSVGSTTSNAATLTVNAGAPTILTQPESAQVTNGTNRTLFVTASGSDITFQWRKNGTNIAGATNVTLPFPSVSPADAGSYSVVITGSLGAVTSTTAVLSTFMVVTPSPTVTIPIGSQPSFNVAITGGGGTVTDDNNNSQTNHLNYLRVKDNTTNQYWDQNLSGGSANLTWYDPRGAMAAGTHTFTFTSCYTGLESYNENDGADIGIRGNDNAVLDAQTVAVTAGIVAPSIVTQPVSLTKTAGLTATFNVAATGSGPFTYQWRKNGTNISGATSQSLVLLNAQAADAASYTVVVSNSVGSTTSNAATLTVNAAAPTILTQPESAQVTNGTNRTLFVTASGSDITFQWRKNGTNIAGATNATLPFPSLSPADAGSYSVVITGSLGAVTSTTAVLSTFMVVTPAPTVTIPIGTAPSFSVAITGGGGTVTDDNNNSQTNNLTHLRVKDNTTNQYWDQNLSSGSANLTWSDPRGGMAAGTHSFTVTAYYTGFSAYNNDGDIGFHQDEWSVLDAQTVAVTAGIVAPSIVTQPGSLTKTAGLTATFNVAASGSPPFTYQWRKNGTNITGATSQSLVLLNVQAADATSYTVVVSNSVGSTTSNAATLMVNAAAPTILAQPESAQLPNGTNRTLFVTASGSDITFQWRKNGTNIAGATNATLPFPNLSPADAGNYSVVITGSLGAVTSTTAVLSTFMVVTPAPTEMIPIGTAPGFSVAISGGGSTVTDDNDNSQTNNLTHLRVRDNTTNQEWDQNLSGASANPTWSDPRGGMAAGTHSFTLTAYYTGLQSYNENDGADIGIRGGEWAVLDAQTVIVTAVNGSPVINSQPVGQVVFAGASAAFTVTAWGLPAPNYQWRKNGLNISGATSSTLTFSNVQSADAATYTVVVSNVYGTVTSNPTVLELGSPPTALNYAEKTATTVTLVWRAATSSQAVTSYIVYRGGTLIGTTGDLVFTDTGLSANTAYLYTVKAQDAAGNYSAESSSFSVTTTQDFSADSDHDGIPNTVETALGSSAGTSASYDSNNSQTQLKIQRPPK